MRIRVRPRALGAALLSTLLLAPATSDPTWAGPPDPSPRPLVVPWSVAAEAEGVDATLYHAAGLGFVSGLELGLGVHARLDDDAPPSSVTGLVGGRLGPFALGLGLSRLGDGFGTSGVSHRFDVGLAMRLGDAFSLGVQRHSLSHDTAAALDDYAAWSLSATWRPARALSVAGALDRVDKPRLGLATLDPVARLSVGLRPGTERLTLALEAAADLGDDGPLSGAASLRAMVLPGLGLGAYGRYSEADLLGPERVEWGAWLGLYQSGVVLESSVDAFTPSDDADPSGAALAFLLRAGVDQTPTLLRRSSQVVLLTVRGTIAERPKPTLFAQGPTPFGHWLMALDAMGRDDDVAGVVIRLEGAPGWGQSWELRQALTRLKERGKKVFFYLNTGDMRAMYLASVGDRIWLHPAGGLWLTGLAVTQQYFAELLGRLGVNPEFVKWDEFKSAPERLTRRGPSDPAQLQQRVLMEAFRDAWYDAVSTGRSLPRDQLTAILDDGPQTMDMAVQLRLVDALVHQDEIDDRLREILGPGAHLVRSWKPPRSGWRRWSSPDRVAIIPIVGNIVDGKTLPATPLFGEETTGDESIVQVLQSAASDDDVLGVVLRVDSPGGAVIASDKMHRAVQRVARRKPVVVSFGNIAASGGYYAAVGAPTIVAPPTTITGSIGIFSGKVDLSGLYALLGIDTFTYKERPHADFMGDHRPFTPEERERARERLRTYYMRFVTLVAQGRNLPVEEALERAKGRVYPGSLAIDLKLVDRAGSLWDAIAEVRRKAGQDEDDAFSLSYPETPRGLGDLTRMFASEVLLETPAAAVASGEDAALAVVRRLVQALAPMQRGGDLARMPVEIEIR